MEVTANVTLSGFIQQDSMCIHYGTTPEASYWGTNQDLMAYQNLYFMVILVYKFKRIVGKPNLSDQFKKIIKRDIYSCPMKTHHFSDAHSRGLSKAVQNCVICIYYLGQMQCFRTKISIPVTPLTHDVTSAFKLR